MQTIFYKAVSQAEGKDCKFYNELCGTVFQEALSNVGFTWVHMHVQPFHTITVSPD